jgi:hypothetical protein
LTVTYVESESVAAATGRTSVSVPVPAGATNKDIVTVGIYKEHAAAITPPDGTWTLAGSETTNVTTQGGLWVFWKRLTGADAGPYIFTWTGTIYAGAQAILARGCAETGDPWAGKSIVRTANNAGATVSTSCASEVDGMGVSFCSSWALALRTFTQPSGWTKPEQNNVMATGYKTGMGAGSTGTLTWTGSGNDYYHMFLGVLKPHVVSAPATTIYAIIGGVKKAVTPYVIIGGVKEPATAFAIVGGVKK